MTTFKLWSSALDWIDDEREIEHVCKVSSAHGMRYYPGKIVSQGPGSSYLFEPDMDREIDYVYGRTLQEALRDFRNAADTHRFDIRTSGYGFVIFVPYDAHKGFYMRERQFHIKYMGQTGGKLLSELKAMMKEAKI